MTNYLAAGVISRAVLEEKLRNMCNNSGISLNKAHPTLSDFNTELYKANIYDKIEFKNIEYLICIGNNAAHNQSVKKNEVEKLIEGVKSILLKYK